VDGIITRDGSRFLSEAVILTTGSWTPVLLPHLSKVMWPVGQPVFHFSPENVRDYQPPKFPVWGLDAHTSGWYGFPTNNDGILKVANHGPGWRWTPAARAGPGSEEGRFREPSEVPPAWRVPLAYTRLCFYCDTFDGTSDRSRPDRQGYGCAAARAFKSPSTGIHHRRRPGTQAQPLHPPLARASRKMLKEQEG
jgi:glycine/D-amino acid oxidase-like deaminating enzyme